MLYPHDCRDELPDTLEKSARSALDSLAIARDSVNFRSLSFEEAEQCCAFIPDHIYDIDEGDAFHTEKHLATFEADYDGLKFHFSFATIIQEDAHSNEYPFVGLMVQVQGLPGDEFLQELGFSSDFSRVFHDWRDYLSIRCQQEI